ncbi:flagellar hook protein FlgE [Acetobacter syzygii]|uniref:flagellar hook protein FlgE n=1 Tax=Acetobacter syzygii TaxID=146476 RepID=UPI0039EB0A5C
MSIFNSLTTAVSGINAQSTAFTNLSNNIANSQTVGYKADTTAFQDFVAGAGTTSGSFAQGVANSVAAVTVQHVNSQGTASSSTDGLAMSISGNGLFNVSKPSESTQYYTRNGEFYEDKSGYLINTSGYYLDGYMVNSKTGALDTTKLTQINVANVAFRPTQTTTITAAGTLSSSNYSTPITTTVHDGGYDQDKTTNDQTDITMTWGTPTASTDSNGNAITTSTLTISPQSSSGGVGYSDNGYSGPTYTVTFDSSGTIKSITDSAGKNVSSTLSGASATIPINVTYPNGTTQSVSIDLGTIGGTGGMTYSTTATVAPALSNDTVLSGTYQSAEIESDGSVMAVFDNGDTQLIGKVALSNFANVNGLLSQDGQAYTATASSGSAKTGLVGNNATGSLKVGYVESSTTDLTSDLSALIVAQEAYTANTKIVTTADQLLQTTIAMKQ